MPHSRCHRAYLNAANQFAAPSTQRFRDQASICAFAHFVAPSVKRFRDTISSCQSKRNTGSYSFFNTWWYSLVHRNFEAVKETIFRLLIRSGYPNILYSTPYCLVCIFMCQPLASANSIHKPWWYSCLQELDDIHAFNNTQVKCRPAGAATSCLCLCKSYNQLTINVSLVQMLCNYRLSSYFCPVRGLVLSFT